MCIRDRLCDERRGGDLREAVATLPLDRLLLETDCPYLLPRDLKDPPPSGRRNEPALLPHIANAVAQAMGRNVEEVATASTVNAERLFGLHGSR